MTKGCAAAVQVSSRMFDLDTTIGIFAAKLDQAKKADANCYGKTDLGVCRRINDAGSQLGYTPV